MAALSVSDIQRAVSRATKVTGAQMHSQSRIAERANARFLCWFLELHLLGRSYTQIGRSWRRDGTTVRGGIQRASEWQGDDADRRDRLLRDLSAPFDLADHRRACAIHLLQRASDRGLLLSLRDLARIEDEIEAMEPAFIRPDQRAFPVTITHAEEGVLTVVWDSHLKCAKTIWRGK